MGEESWTIQPDAKGYGIYAPGEDDRAWWVEDEDLAAFIVNECNFRLQLQADKRALEAEKAKAAQELRQARGDKRPPRVWHCKDCDAKWEVEARFTFSYCQECHGGKCEPTDTAYDVLRTAAQEVEADYETLARARHGHQFWNVDGNDGHRRNFEDCQEAECAEVKEHLANLRRALHPTEAPQ